MHDETVVGEFTQQAAAFNASAIAHAAGTLGALVELAAPQAGERWLDVACGPRIVCRALAAHAGSVHGIDLTPAMVELARTETAAAGIANATFAVGDATAIDAPDACFDGAVARFAIHHVPAPGRMLSQLARVLRPGGRIVLADHLLDDDADAAAWSQEIERLRDPSHWACLTLARQRTLARRAGLQLEHEEVFAAQLDFDDWLARGSGGAAAGATIEGLLAERPAAAACFRVIQRDGRRVLELRMWLVRWRR